MFKIAAILTTATIMCTGAACPQNDAMTCRVVQERCNRPAIICTWQQPCAPSACIPGCDGDIDYDAPAVEPDESEQPAETPAPSQTQHPVQTPAPSQTEQPIQTPAVTPEPTQTPDESVGSYAQEVVRLVNIEREKAGLSALEMDATLSQAAQKRAEECAQSFAHTRPDGTSCFTVLKEYGISYRACGENIAKGSPTPERVVDGWMNSAGHRANILNENFTTIGVGYYVDNTGTAHWAQLFTA